MRNNNVDPQISFVGTRGYFPSVGEKMQIDNLDKVLEICSRIEKKSQKHMDGAICPYVADRLGIDRENSISGGLIFIDIDNITKQCAETIFNNFEVISDDFRNLYAIQYSSSQFLKPDQGGLHIYVRSGQLNYNQYHYYATLALAAVARIIHKDLNIDLRQPQIYQDNKPLDILDEHNTRLSQRFFLYHSPYKKNPKVEIFQDRSISTEDIKRLKQEYPTLQWQNDVQTVYYTNQSNMDGLYSSTDKITGKIKIDRFFKIGPYSGNDIRWRISRIAQFLFKENAKTWCDQYFYCGANQSIYSRQVTENGINNIILNWLEENGYIKKNVQKDNHLDKGEYLIKYKDKILDFISNNQQCEIIAPTGTGKTTFINGIKGESFNLFNNNEIDMFSLAKELNAIVIVPFNATIGLYDNITEISTQETGDNEINPDEPAVMVWDQAIKHWSSIKHRTLIMDEVHCLFNDRIYRDSAVRLMKTVKEENTRIVMFTATPTGESEEIGCPVLTFTSSRNSIPTTFAKVNHIDAAQANYIGALLQKNIYDKIVLFDDRTAAKVYENLIIDGFTTADIAYIRKDTEKTEDYRLLKETEYLRKPLTICTCIAFNGLNFKNKNEKILIITSFRSGETTASQIIQQAGRIRNASAELIVFYDEKDMSTNLEERIEQAELFKNIEIQYRLTEHILPYSERLFDEDIQNACRKVHSFFNDNAQKDKVIENLTEQGYFLVTAKDYLAQNDKVGDTLSKPLKKKYSDEFIQDIMNGSMLEQDYQTDTTGKNYKRVWQDAILYMIGEETKNREINKKNLEYTGITIETIKNMYMNTNKTNLISTIIKKMKDIIRILMIDDREWNNYIDAENKIMALLKNNQVMLKKCYTSYKTNKKIRKTYMGLIKKTSGQVGDFFDMSEVFGNVIQNEEKLYNEEKEKKSVKHMKAVMIGNSFKRPEKYRLSVGMLFDSQEKLAEYANVTKLTVIKWKKAGWITDC